jgi:hypothetical protein
MVILLDLERVMDVEETNMAARQGKESAPMPESMGILRV